MHMDYVNNNFVVYPDHILPLLQMNKELINYRKIAEQIFLAGVESVLPERLIANVMSLRDNNLKIGSWIGNCRP